MPADKDGKRIVPAAGNRNDGFSPGQTILTHVRGLDNERAFNRTNPVQLEDLSRYTKRRKAPIVVINAKTGERHPIWAELDPHPKRRRTRTSRSGRGSTGTRATRYIVALRNLGRRRATRSRRAPRSASTATTWRRTAG